MRKIKTFDNIGMLSAADLWLIESFVYLRNISSEDKKVCLTRRQSLRSMKLLTLTYKSDLSQLSGN
jgi:hypothetical protein